MNTSMVVIFVICVALSAAYIYFYRSGKTPSGGIPITPLVPSSKMEYAFDGIGYMYPEHSEFDAGKDDFEIRFGIKTRQSNAFVMSSNLPKQQTSTVDTCFVVFIQNDVLKFVITTDFVNGIILQSDKNLVNDGFWHDIVITRAGGERWSISVDRKSSGYTQKFNEKVPKSTIYVGDRPFREVTPGSPPLVGCLRLIAFDGKMYDYTTRGLIGRKC